MPLQNRVTPFGDLVRSPSRGTLMGNRGGCLHDDNQELTRSRWKGRRWIACLLEFRGRWRAVMQPHRYTELFFLDEVTALAAGHRPCAQCRWEDYQRFKALWLDANVDRGVEARDSIDAIDVWLQRERIDRSGRKVTSRLAADALPSGSMVALDGSPLTARLVWEGRLYDWSLEGYANPTPVPFDTQVTLLTPFSIMRTLAAGYVPLVHASIIEAATTSI
jgi:hypothetical protein